MKCLLVLFFLAVDAIFDDAVLLEFTNGNHQFAADVYKHQLGTEKSNFIVSPLSAEIVLSLATEGSREKTFEELTTAIKLPKTREGIAAAISSFLPTLQKRTANTTLITTNKVYVNKGYAVNKNYTETATKLYNAEVENADFGQPEVAAANINKWVANKTNNKIKDIISPKILSDDTKVLLVNALYFSGKWVNEFDLLLSRNEKFYTSEKKFKMVPTMFSTNTYKYYFNKELGAKFLELPYIGDDLKMTVVLPSKIEGLGKLEENIEEVLKPQPLVNLQVYVTMPKFSIESKINFAPILKNLGVKRAFMEGEADLSGIGGNPGQLFIADVLQKTFINVTETGTEAAAATIALIDTRVGDGNLPPTEWFLAEHPFLYHITYKNITLFIDPFQSRLLIKHSFGEGLKFKFDLEIVHIYTATLKDEHKDLEFK